MTGPLSRAELERLHRAFRPALLRYFVRRLGDRSEAEDLIQDVFVRLARADICSMRCPQAYLFRIGVNLLRDRTRHARIRAAYRRDLAAESGLGIDGLDPARILGDRQALLTLSRAVAELPEPTRTVFVRARLEDTPRRKIAEMHRLSDDAVDRHLAKALAFLDARVRGAAL